MSIRMARLLGALSGALRIATYAGSGAALTLALQGNWSAAAALWAMSAWARVQRMADAYDRMRDLLDAHTTKEEA